MPPLLRPTIGRERIEITPRDLDILRAVEAHRYVRTDHVRQLLFARATARSAQLRLQKLWHHGYIERAYLASVVGGERRPPRGAGTPVYALGAKGRLALHGERAASGPDGEFASASTIQHDLIVTDFLVALIAAARDRAELWVTETLHDWDFWKRLHGRKPGASGHLVPDGAVSIRRAGQAVPETYYLEVVRADVKAGNGTLREKMLRYAEANHRGAFRELYGHERVRAILIATTSSVRAEHFRALSGTLPHGRQLFGFASYEDRDADGRAVPRFTAARILGLPWMTAGEEALTLGVSTPSPA